MLVNGSKHQCLILGDTEYSFSFPVKDTLEIFGMEIDNNLNFSKHISMYAKRLIINLMLCCAFENSYAGKSYSNFLPHFYYCSSVWRFCGARDADKLEALNKRILRFILGDY